MRFIFSTLLTLVFVHLGFAQEMKIEKISPALWEQMMDSGLEKLPVHVLLKDQVDIRAIRIDFNRRNVSLEERTATLLPLLQNKAQETQGPLLDYLRSLPDLDQNKLIPLWITNVIDAELTIAQIKALSLRADVGELEWIEPAFHSTVTEAAAPPTSVNGSEPGLRAINADKLWAMGYTGYSRRIMVHDSGAEIRNPALILNYQGYYSAQDNHSYTGNNPSGPTDCAITGLHHGTHVTGTTCGLDRLNNDTIGVAYNAKWLSAPHAGLIGACAEARWGEQQNFQWALNPDGNAMTIDDMPDAINNSYGAQGNCQNNSTTSNSQDALEAVGIAVVWAAGNDGPGQSTSSSASDINHDLVTSFSVGALNSNATTIAGFSSRGPSDCSSLDASLEIKPEVSAPGVSIRSSDGAFGFANSQGTSMAAPHVAGAIVLLKEAFPQLTGEQIKLALYFTCTDLGAPGEDNDFGMGIINVLEAFNYLVDQGNTPADPLRNNDVMIVNIEPLEQECGSGLFSGAVLIENGGVEELTSAVINYEYLQGSNVVASGSTTWTGSLTTRERATAVIPEESGLNGSLTLRVTVNTPNNVEDERPLNNIFLTEIKVIDIPPLDLNVIGEELGDPCTNNIAYLFLDMPEAVGIEWFATASGNNSINSGPYFETSPLPIPFSYYVDVTLSSDAGITDVGATDTTSIGTGQTGLKFDALQDLFLRSMKVYASNPGPRLFQIKDANGGTIKQLTENIQEIGEYTLNWDVEIPEGSDYEVILLAGSGTMRYTTNPTYPYAVGGAINIYGSTDFGTPQDNYYYFYNWNIDYEYGCGRQEVPVNFTSGDAPTVDFSTSTSTPLIDENVVFTNSSTGADTYLWSFGDGTTSTAENSSHIYTEVGTYTVALSASTANGCVVTTITEIVVNLSTSVADDLLSNNISIFPNPTTGHLTIDLALPASQDIQLSIVDVLGQTLQLHQPQSIGNGQLNLDLNSLTNGVYYLIINSKDAQATRKIVKMN